MTTVHLNENHHTTNDDVVLTTTSLTSTNYNNTTTTTLTTTTTATQPLNTNVQHQQQQQQYPSSSQQEQQPSSSSTPPPPEENTSSNNTDIDIDFEYKDMEYAIQSYYAIVQPVLITMILSALAVVYISTPESSQETEEALANTYYVIRTNTDGSNPNISNSEKLGISLVNAFVIVFVICIITFMIVLLYKYNCIKCLIGYMILSTSLLLGYLASIMFQVAIERYQIYIDKISFTIFMYNFAFVGVVAIFLGIPNTNSSFTNNNNNNNNSNSTSTSIPPFIPIYINQLYLIFISVIVAWQLSHFDAWTAWVLLILLALYDLFAVLSPYGPLKALVSLMQRENAPNMPGLLYEASIMPNSNTNNDNTNNTTTTSNNNNDTTNRSSHLRQEQEQHNSTSVTSITTSTTTTNNDSTTIGAAVTTSNTIPTPQPIPILSTVRSRSPNSEYMSIPTTDINTSDQHNHDTQYNNHNDTSINNNNTATTTMMVVDVDTGEESQLQYSSNSNNNNNNNESVEVFTPLLRTGYIPFAIAKLYKLPYRYNSQQSWITTTTTTTVSTNPDDVPTTQNESTTTTVDYTVQQLQELVEVLFPNTGGMIVPTLSLHDSPYIGLYRHTQYTDRNSVRYTVIDYRNIHKRVLFVNPIDGRVYQDLREENIHNDDNNNNGRKARTTIKLGLGDFIFYSILVSKAALYSYTTFIVCTLAVLSGLGITLLLLAIYGKALPALPVSILLGVLYYFFTRYVLEPYVEAIFIGRVYV